MKGRLMMIVSGMKAYKLLWLFIGLVFVSSAFAADTYEAKFKCATTPQYTNSTYVHANSDGQALALANEYISSNTGYRNKGCSVIEVKSQSSSRQLAPVEARYEVLFKCAATPQYTNSTYISATTDTQAALEGKNYFENNTGYRNKGCSVIEVRKQ